MSVEKLPQIITTANIVELTKKTLAKVGLEFAAPLEQNVLDEQILKAIRSHSIENTEK